MPEIAAFESREDFTFSESMFWVRDHRAQTIDRSQTPYSTSLGLYIVNSVNYIDTTSSC